MSAPVLETENLVKVYGRGESRFDALKGLTFEIQQGESVAIVGKSGSGKSTLMHLLALLDEPTAGVVAMNGRPVSQLKAAQVSELRNDTFGFVFQQFFLNANQTVLENVVLPLKIAGVGKAERTRRGMEVLDQLGMADKAKNRATDLSGGQKQRACIARALINGPSVLFADEPTGNLDTATGEVVEDILFGLHAERGITLVIVTHDDDLAARCQRRLLMQDGMIIADESGEAVRAAGAGVGQASREGSRRVGGHGRHAAPVVVDGPGLDGPGAPSTAGSDRAEDSGTTGEARA